MDEVPDLDWRIARATALDLAVKQDDLISLRKWSAEPGGFGSNEIRKKVWPYLLKVRHSTKQKGEPYDERSDDKDERDESGKNATENPTTTDTHEHTINETPHHDPNAKPHKEERQVGLDTNRSFVHYPENISRTEKLRLQGELNELIMTVLRKHEGLSYFQGYHDIISVLYLSFFPYTAPTRPSRSSSSGRSQSGSRSQSRSGSRSQSRSRSRTNSNAGMLGTTSRNSSFGQIKLDGLMTVSGDTRMKPLSPGKGLNLSLIDESLQEKSQGTEPASEGQETVKIPSNEQPEWSLLVDCCEALSLLRIRDGMANSLEPVVGYLRLMKRLIKAVDPEVAALVNKVSPTPYFALSWMLTLFSHDCNTFGPVQRIFDYLLGRNPALVIYLGVALVVLKKDRLMSLKDTLEDDPGILHTNLSLLPPLIADDPSDPTTDGATPGLQMPATARRRDSYLDPEGPNPLPPVILSELFQLTDSLWNRFPLSHPDIRATEIMAEKSVIFTYADGEGDGESELEEIAEWVRDGVDETQVVVSPAAPESEDEVEEPVKPTRPRPRKAQRRSDRPAIGKTTVTFALVVVALGVYWYQGKRPGHAAFVFRLLGPLRRRLEMHRVWQRIRWENVGAEGWAGRLKKMISEAAIGWESFTR